MSGCTHVAKAPAMCDENFLSPPSFHFYLPKRPDPTLAALGSSCPGQSISPDPTRHVLSCPPAIALLSSLLYFVRVCVHFFSPEAYLLDHRTIFYLAYTLVFPLRCTPVIAALGYLSSLRSALLSSLLYFFSLSLPPISVCTYNRPYHFYLPARLCIALPSSLFHLSSLCSETPFIVALLRPSVRPSFPTTQRHHIGLYSY